jgi:prophage DNA circulation protein
MKLPSNVVGALPELRWRNLSPVPCEHANYDFTHDQVERRYPYIDGASHDHTGRGPIKFSARLLFMNTAREGLYPDEWAIWRAALMDGSSGPLRHPELGKVRARVESASVALVASARAGVVVDVSWVESFEDPENLPVARSLRVNLTAAARAADSACSALGIPYPRIGDSTNTSLLDDIKQLEGQAFSASLTALGKANQIIGAVRQMEDQADKLSRVVRGLDTPLSVWPSVYNLHQVHYELTQFLRAKATSRPVATRTLAASSTLDAFARAVSNTVTEIVQLNPGALGRPTVPSGTVLSYYV